MKKIKQIIIIIVFLISVLVLIFINNSKQTNNSDQIMIENTYTISKQYVLLRYQTDNILRNAKTYKDYDSWNKEMSEIISRWEQLEKDALDLENIASNFSEEKISFNMILKAQAYSKQEISDVFDKAPAGKKIKTLAKFL
jgi:predicted  nucleic acid-binding Zn-ribbon protein